MKVYHSKPRAHWISPWSIVECIIFWRDIERTDRSACMIVRILAPICRIIRSILDFIHPEITYVKIDHWDTWSIDRSLSVIILPMLEQLRRSKLGSPFVDDQDVPVELRSTSCPPVEQYDVDQNYHKRWDYVLDEMIWGFRQLVDDNHEDKFWLDRGEIDWDNRQPHADRLVEIKWKRQSVVDWDGLKSHNARIDNATRLFGRYFRNLWD